METSAPTLRQSMSWLHTYAGVVFGSVLFAMIWMGTLSVFDREIDRWMMPGTRLRAPPAALSLDATVRPLAEAQAGKSAQWSAALPTPRTPTLVFRYQDASGKSTSRHADPRTGKLIDDPGTLGGTGFIFPFHFRLHISWLGLGFWLVGLAGMVMLVLLVSGVIIHRRIFKDFFTFRPDKPLRRSSLDLHNLTGALALPFHFVMALSGLIVFFSVYFPWTWQAAYQSDNRAFTREVFGNYRRALGNAPGALGSLDAMAVEAERQWGGAKPSFVRVVQPADAASYVELRRSSATQVSVNRDQIYFDGQSGVPLHRLESGPVAEVQRFVAGVHLAQFEHWSLRWLYFLGGLAACVMVASGQVFWLTSRRGRHAERALSVRVMHAMTVFAVTGIIMATLAFFVANRALPGAPSIGGVARADLEMWIFYLTWLSTLGHAEWRSRAAWAEQTWAIAGLALAAVLANWVSTGDHVLRAGARGLWSVAGMDLLLLASSGLAVIVARRLERGALAKRRALSTQGSIAAPFDAEPHA